MIRLTSALALLVFLSPTPTIAQSPAEATPVTPAPAPTTAVAAPAAIRPVEQFAKLPFLESPDLSPDGSKIAARVNVNGKALLVIMPLAKGAGAPIPIGIGNFDLNWVSWVNNDWLIANVSAVSRLMGIDYYATRIVAIKADGTKVTMLGRNTAAQNGGDVLWIARDGSPRILLSMQTSVYPSEDGFFPSVFSVDVSTGRMLEVAGPIDDVFDWYADADGNVRMGIGTDDVTGISRLHYRDAGARAFRVVNRARRAKDETLIAPALFLTDPTKALTYSSSDGFDALYELDLTTLSVGKKVFGVEGYDIGGFVTDSTGKELAGIRYTDTRARTNWIDPDLAEVQSAIDKAVGNRVAHIASWSQDRQKLLVHVGGPDRIGAYYFFDRSYGALRIFARQNESLGNSGLAPVKTIRYKARDGLEIEAVLTLPAGREAKNLPLILMPHGGPFARDEESWDWWTQFLANRGYAVIQPNYRGSSGYGDSFAEKGEGQWGLAMQDDLNDAVDWAVKEGIADAKRVCIVGGSYGGYAAFRAAQRDPAKYRCAVSYAGVSDLAGMIRYNSNFFGSKGSKLWLKEQAPDFKAVSPINFAESFGTPILIMHGKEDRRVPVAQSRTMVAKLKSAGKDHVYIEQPLADHFFSREEDRLQFLNELEAFLKKHNPA